jgi:hypothetical protein
MGRRAPTPAQRRRRERHFRLRRRDLLFDTIAGAALSVLLISLTAGLGVLALIVVPAGAILLATRLAGRSGHRRPPHRRPPHGRPPHRRPAPAQRRPVPGPGGR